jgi:hypothetical protein
MTMQHVHLGAVRPFKKSAPRANPSAC